MSYRLIDSNMLADRYPEVNDMPCIYLDLPNGLDNQHHGTVLPKGHGRLIDEKVLLRKLRSRNFGFNLPTWIKVAIDNTPTIIEADKED